MLALDSCLQCLEVLADAIDGGDVESRLEGDLVGATLRERTGEND